MFLLLISLIASTSAFGAIESQVEVKYSPTRVWEYYSNYRHSFQGVPNAHNGNPVEISYLKFENNEGSLGTALVLAGRAESSLKFIELAEDLLKQGYSTVYVLDQRGQGLSTRLHKNDGVTDARYEKVHLDEATNMTLDLGNFINSEMVKGGKPPYVAFGHITGALPLVDYLQRVSGRIIFDKVVLISPLFKLKTGKIEQLLYDWVIDPLYSVPTTSSFPFFREDSKVPFQKKKNELGIFETNNRTHSEKRFNAVKDVFRTVPVAFSENSTVRWANEIFEFQKLILSSQKTIQTPILIVTAKGDELLDNSVSESFCNKNLSKTLNCQFVGIEESRHWVLFEEDLIRNKALKAIFDFLSNKQSGGEHLDRYLRLN